MRIVDREAIAKALCELERIHAEVRANDGAAPPHTQEIGQLAGAAPNFENLGSLGNLLIEQSGKHTPARLSSEGAACIKAVIVREGGLLVELFHDIGDVGSSDRPVVRCEKTRDSRLHRIGMATGL